MARNEEVRKGRRNAPGKPVRVYRGRRYVQAPLRDAVKSIVLELRPDSKGLGADDGDCRGASHGCTVRGALGEILRWREKSGEIRCEELEEEVGQEEMRSRHSWWVLGGAVWGVRGKINTVVLARMNGPGWPGCRGRLVRRRAGELPLDEEEETVS